ncbi:MAG: glutathionylspermidine synthase family protein [Chloroflexota bacterium]
MRALVTDRSRVPDGLYRRFVRRAQVEGRLADHLYAGEPYLALNAIAIAPDESARLARLTGVFSRVFDRAASRLAGDVSRLQELGFPWVAAELLSAEQPRVPVVGRFDWLQDVAGRWWLLEFNADTPSGLREAMVADRLVHELLPEARGLARPSDGLADRVAEEVARAMEGLPGDQTLGLVTDAGELEDLSQMAFTRDVLKEPLARRNTVVALGDVDNLRRTSDGLALGRQLLGALYRYYPFESMLGLPAFAAIYEAVAEGKLRLLNGLYGLLLQHKGLIAWLWEHRNDSDFSTEERAAIRDHLPPTRGIADDPAEIEGPVVIKQVFGREGEEVFFSEDLLADDWTTLRQRRTYVVQQRIAVAELDAVVWSSTGPRIQRGHVTVGSFAVGGEFAGYYSRFGSKIITARAKWLATLVGGE